MIKVPKSKFKPKAFYYFRLVEETNNGIIITDHGKPVLKIIPVIDSDEKELEELHNSLLKYDSPFKPVDSSEWEVLR